MLNIIDFVNIISIPVCVLNDEENALTHDDDHYHDNEYDDDDKATDNVDSGVDIGIIIILKEVFLNIKFWSYIFHIWIKKTG